MSVFKDSLSSCFPYSIRVKYIFLNIFWQGWSQLFYILLLIPQILSTTIFQEMSQLVIYEYYISSEILCRSFWNIGNNDLIPLSFCWLSLFFALAECRSVYVVIELSRHCKIAKGKCFVKILFSPCVPNKTSSYYITYSYWKSKQCCVFCTRKIEK